MLPYILNILVNYIFVIIYDSFISLFLVLLLLYIFRIKDPNFRILFLFLPLIKPFLIIIEDFKLNASYFTNRYGILGFRFPSPNTIFARIDKIEESPFFNSNINSNLTFILLLIILTILIYRWISLYYFYKKIAKTERKYPAELPILYSIIDIFSKKFKIKTTSLILTHGNNFSPFVIGIKKQNIVIPNKLLNELDFCEKEILIHHELCHIKRRDNLIGWIAIIFRDMLFFNPFAYIAYALIRTEQEKSCDKIVFKHSGYSQKKMAELVINLIIKVNTNNRERNKDTQNYVNFFTPFKKINYYLIYFRIQSILKTDPNKISVNKFMRVFLYLLFFFILFFQIVLFFKINDTFIFLR